jgi:hypothetical protein
VVAGGFALVAVGQFNGVFGVMLIVSTLTAPPADGAWPYLQVALGIADSRPAGPARYKPVAAPRPPPPGVLSRRLA